MYIRWHMNGLVPFELISFGSLIKIHKLNNNKQYIEEGATKDIEAMYRLRELG